MSSTSSRRIEWKRVFQVQDWPSVALTIFILVGLLISSSIDNASSRPYYVWDATISMPYNHSSTIPYWLVPVVPLISLLICLAIFEILMIYTLNTNATTAMAISIHFVLDFIGSGITNVFITEITKLVVGRLRPDWLSRCQPSAPSAGTLQVAFGEPASDNSACLSGLSDSTLSDGHKSFPSGHASTAASLGIFVAGYCIWSAYYRTPIKYAISKSENRDGFIKRFVQELGTTIAFFFALFQIGWLWGVAVSRVVDYKHHPSDIIAGLFLGTVIALAYLSRSIPRHYWVTEQPDNFQTMPLLDSSVNANNNNNSSSSVQHGGGVLNT